MGQGTRVPYTLTLESARQPLRVIAVVSGKGGVGKTHMATNLAVLAAQRRRRVLLIDADLGLANCEILLGVRVSHHIGDLLDRRIPIDQVLIRGPAGVHLLAGGSGIRRLERLEPEDQLRLLEALNPLEESFDTVFIDAGAGIGDNVLFFAGAAQETIVVLNHEPTALTDAYATVKVLSKEAGVRRFHVLVNNVPNELEARRVFAALTSVTQRFLEASLSYLGSVPSCPAIQRAVLAQAPVVELYPQSPSARALADIEWELLAGRAPDVELGSLKVLWRRLAREQA